MVTALRQLSYEARLNQCKLTTLETGKLIGRSDKGIQITYVFEDTDKNDFVKVREVNITRGHNLMISKEQCKLDSQRVANIWNKLLTDCFNTACGNLFKNT